MWSLWEKKSLLRVTSTLTSLHTRGGKKSWMWWIIYQAFVVVCFYFLPLTIKIPLKDFLLMFTILTTQFLRFLIRPSLKTCLILKSLFLKMVSVCLYLRSASHSRNTSQGFLRRVGIIHHPVFSVFFHAHQPVLLYSSRVPFLKWFQRVNFTLSASHGPHKYLPRFSFSCSVYLSFIFSSFSY